VPPTADLAPPRQRLRDFAPPAPDRQPRWTPASSRYGLIGLGSLALAALSLRFPSTPTYDPWSWIIWGREITHLSLVTTGGPTWKPLPVIFTTLFSPFGQSAPQLWLMLARAGGIAALGLASMLAFRLTRTMTTRRWAAVLAGAFAAGALFVLPQYVDYVALGESEGLLAAATLMAANRHLDAASPQALFWAFVVTLDRPEAWPFFALYAIYLVRGDRTTRRRATVLAGLILPLWFVPELIGSGSLIRGVQTAQHPRPEAATFARCPFCTEITDHALRLVAPPLWLAAIALLAFAAMRWRRGEDGSWAPIVSVIVGVGAGWFLEEAILTQAGFSGNNRYLVGAAALLVVAASIAVGGAAAWAIRWMSRIAGASAIRFGAIALAVAAAAGVVWAQGSGVHVVSFSPTVSSLRFQAKLRSDLERAVRRAGGPAALTACGPVQTNPSEVPLAAWDLGLGLSDLASSRGAVIIRSRNSAGAPILPALPSHRRYRLVAHVGTMAIFTSCGASPAR
jgi:hypothetical protein